MFKFLFNECVDFLPVCICEEMNGSVFLMDFRLYIYSRNYKMVMITDAWSSWATIYLLWGICKHKIKSIVLMGWFEVCLFKVEISRYLRISSHSCFMRVLSSVKSSIWLGCVEDAYDIEFI